MGKFASLVVCFLPVVGAHRMVVDVAQQTWPVARAHHMAMADAAWEEFSTSSSTNISDFELVGFGDCQAGGGAQYLSYAQHRVGGSQVFGRCSRPQCFEMNLYLCARVARDIASASPSGFVGFVLSDPTPLVIDTNNDKDPDPACTLYFSEVSDAAVNALHENWPGTVSIIEDHRWRFGPGPVEGSGGDLVLPSYSQWHLAWGDSGSRRPGLSSTCPEAHVLCYRVL